MPSFLISMTWQSCSGPSQPLVLSVLLVETPNTVWGPPAESGFWGPEMGSRRRRRLTGSHHELLVLGVPAVLHACGGRKGSGRDRGRGRAARPPPPGPARPLPDNPKPTRRARPRAGTGAGGAWGGLRRRPAPLALRTGRWTSPPGRPNLPTAWATPGPSARLCIRPVGARAPCLLSARSGHAHRLPVRPSDSQRLPGGSGQPHVSMVAAGTVAEAHVAGAVSSRSVQ